jgi:hypothetical protein
LAHSFSPQLPAVALPTSRMGRFWSSTLASPGTEKKGAASACPPNDSPSSSYI